MLQPESSGLESISANAQTITDHVCEFVTEAKLEISKIRGIETDGVSTSEMGAEMELLRATEEPCTFHHKCPLCCPSFKPCLFSCWCYSSLCYKINLRHLFDFF